MVALNSFIFAFYMSLHEYLFDIKSYAEFQKVTLAVFKYQFEHNSVYRSFCDLLYKHPSDITRIEEIPFLPIQFFKTHPILAKAPSFQSDKGARTITFSSSGTTGSITSKHQVTDISIYKNSFRKGFQHFYGAIEEYVVLALLPSYLEREGSSLIYMVDDLIKKSNHSESGFFLKNHQELAEKLQYLDKKGQKVLLIGVSFALVDLIEKYTFNLNNTIIMETGGMKGKRKELIRNELHEILCEGFGVQTIHSEYGMTELLSQAYSKGNGVFECTPWMHILTRDTEDPLSILEHQKTGGINVIDLANLNSCSFIATQDLGKTYDDGSFEILGRFDNSDIRGCNLMVY